MMAMLIGHTNISGASIQSRISPNSERCSRLNNLTPQPLDFMAQTQVRASRLRSPRTHAACHQAWRTAHRAHHPGRTGEDQGKLSGNLRSLPRNREIEDALREYQRLFQRYLLLSGMSFLGLGVQPPDADLGSLVRENIGGLNQGAPAIVIPALAIGTLTIGVNLFIDRLSSRRSRRTGGH